MTLNSKEGGLNEVQKVFHLIEETFVGWEETIRRQTSDANDEFVITRGDFEQINTAIKALPHVMQMLQILTMEAHLGKKLAEDIQKLINKELEERKK
tara:strand:+ start:4587 stop:4877 length:291 start_codon:yes stop_codon:yes gene_type:complete